MWSLVAGGGRSTGLNPSAPDAAWQVIGTLITSEGQVQPSVVLIVHWIGANVIMLLCLDLWTQVQHHETHHIAGFFDTVAHYWSDEYTELPYVGSEYWSILPSIWPVVAHQSRKPLRSFPSLSTWDAWTGDTLNWTQAFFHTKNVPYCQVSHYSYFSQYTSLWKILAWIILMFIQSAWLYFIRNYDSLWYWDMVI